MTDLAPFEVRNAAARESRKRVNWDERTQLVHQVFPDTANPDWAAITADLPVFGRIMRDVLKADQVEPGRAGPRPPLDQRRALDSLRRFADDDYTTLPFHAAVAALIGQQSRTQVSRKTGIERTRCHRLIVGTTQPELTEIEAFAKAYGKRPEYFAEYRIGFILNRLQAKLTTEPESSVVMYKRMVHDGSAN